MSAASDWWENRLCDGLFRRGVKQWTVATAYPVGSMCYGNTANSYGKVMLATAIAGSGTSHASTEPTWPAVNDTTPNTVVDNAGANQITWTVYAVGMYSPPLWVALFTTAPNVETGAGGTECSGGSYVRVAVHPSTTTWQGTQATTAYPSSGTSGQVVNNSAVSFVQATGSWGTVLAVGLYDASSGGNLLYSNTVTSQLVSSGNTVTFNASSMTIVVDN